MQNIKNPALKKVLREFKDAICELKNPDAPMGRRKSIPNEIREYFMKLDDLSRNEDNMSELLGPYCVSFESSTQIMTQYWRESEIGREYPLSAQEKRILDSSNWANICAVVADIATKGFYPKESVGAPFHLKEDLNQYFLMIATETEEFLAKNCRPVIRNLMNPENEPSKVTHTTTASALFCTQSTPQIGN